jgi:hypothetical protein
MPYVPAPKDLNKVKVKFLFGLTKRQIICFGLAALFGVPVFFLTKKTIGNEFSMLLMVIIMMPFFFLGMYERNGIPAETIAKNRVRHMYWPGIRPYRTENLFTYLGNIENRGERNGKGKSAGAKPGASGRPAVEKQKKAGRD